MVLSASMVALTAAVGASLWRDACGKAALDEALALLDAPFATSPELHDLDADTIVARLEEAETYGLTLPDGLKSEADALAHHRRNESVFATGALAASRQADGWTARRRVLAAAIAREGQDVNGAWEHVREALALSPADPRALLLTADLALDRDDVRAATNALRRLREAEPEVAAVHNRLGLALELAGDASEAVHSFERAAVLDPEHHGAFINLGRAHRRAGDLEAASAAFERATRLQPGDADAWLGAGLVALDLHDVDSARESLDRAAELAPHASAAQAALGDLATLEGRHADAVDAYRTALSRNDGDASTWVKLGNALVRDGGIDEGIRAFGEALRREDLAAAHNGLGAALARLRDPRAAEELARAATLDPQDPNPLMNLALLREREGALDEAREAWRGALARHPGHPVAAERLARISSI